MADTVPSIPDTTLIPLPQQRTAYHSYVSKTTHKLYKDAWEKAGKPKTETRCHTPYLRWGKLNKIPITILSITDWLKASPDTSPTEDVSAVPPVSLKKPTTFVVVAYVSHTEIAPKNIAASVSHTEIAPAYNPFDEF
jgi:hypothetical protein